jgi:hypothetical protein
MGQTLMQKSFGDNSKKEKDTIIQDLNLNEMAFIDYLQSTNSPLHTLVLETLTKGFQQADSLLFDEAEHLTLAVKACLPILLTMQYGEHGATIVSFWQDIFLDAFLGRMLKTGESSSDAIVLPDRASLSVFSLPFLSHLCDILRMLMTVGLECFEMERFANIINTIQNYVETNTDEKELRRQLLSQTTSLRQIWKKEQKRRAENEKYIMLQAPCELKEALPNTVLSFSSNVAGSSPSKLEDLRKRVHEVLTLKQPFYHIHMPDKTKSEVRLCCVL